MRETVQLYGSSLTESKISIFYVTISNAIIFNQFSARFCMPTSTTSSLQIVSMCTDNGLIKYFNCSLLYAFPEKHEYLFNNIRILIEKKENYYIFIKAIQHFNNILDAEESEIIDNDSFSRCITSYISNWSESQQSEYSIMTGINSDGIDIKSSMVQLLL